MDLELLKEYQDLPDSPKRQRILDKLVRDNMPLVDKLVRKYSIYSAVHFEPEDVHQAGLIGLIRGIRGFDFTRGTRFSTYVALWIRREIQMHLEKCTPIRRPNKVGLPYKVLRKGEAHTAQFGTTPNAEDLGITEAQHDRWNALIFHFMPMDEVHDDGVSRDDFAHDEQTAEEALIEHERLRVAERALRSLTEIERRILVDGDTKGIPAGIVEHTRETAIKRLRAFFEDP